MTKFIWGKCLKLFSSFFGFFCLSNLCPHSLSSFDFTRHLAAGDILFDSDTLKVLLKWSKTIQLRDKVKLISLPKLGRAAICPVRALSKMLKMYSQVVMVHCFSLGINQVGRYLAFSSHVPLQQIKMQGIWSSDCVWQYIHSNPDNASQVASTFAKLYAL